MNKITMINQKHQFTFCLWLALFAPMSVFGQQTFKHTITYDGLAQVTRFEYSDGSCVHYQYDNEIGVASTVTYQSGGETQILVSDISLNESGLVTSIATDGGQKTYDYDTLNQLVEQRFDYEGITRYHAQKHDLQPPGWPEEPDQAGPFYQRHNPIRLHRAGPAPHL